MDKLTGLDFAPSTHPKRDGNSNMPVLTRRDSLGLRGTASGGDGSGGLRVRDQAVALVEEELQVLSSYTLSFSLLLLSYYDSDDDDDNDEYTNLCLSASCPFYSYTPHFPSPSPSFLPYLTIPFSSSIRH
jgi:hypothetical protein